MNIEYNRGGMGLPQSRSKARKLWLRAGELGHDAAHCCVGYAYEHGEGVERDVATAKYYYELAAIGGNVTARYNLGLLEENAGNVNRAVKHWMISAAAGYDNSLTAIREFFMSGYVTKHDFEKALRSHKEAKDEMMTSDQREACAAAMQDGRLQTR